MLLRNGETSDVENWLNRYDRVRKDGASLPIRVKLLVRQKREKEAVALVSRWIGELRPPPWPQARIDQVKTAATLMHSLRQSVAAETLWRAYTKAYPPGVIALAECVGVYRDIDESFALLDKSIEHHPPQSILLVGMRILRARKSEAQPEHYQKLGKWYTAASQSESSAPHLEMLLGDIWEMRGNLSEAEKVYRHVLARKDLDPVVRAGVGNNLAFILSTQNKNTDEAVQLIENAMEVYGPSSDLLDTRGVVYLAAGKPDRALADFREAVLDPSAMKWVHLAFAHDALKEQEAARTALKKAQEMDLKKEDLYDAEWTRYERLARELGML
jgi:cellulose synthase operon protein C